MRRAWRRWRLERAELRLADLEHYAEEWGWSNTPSQQHALDKRIARAEKKVRAIEVAPDAQPSSPGPTHTEQESE